MYRPAPTFLQSVLNFFDKKQFAAILPWAKFNWSDSYDQVAVEGYAKNSIGHFAVSKIAQKCGEIPLKLWRMEGSKKVEVTTHPILELLQKPNANQKTYSEWVQAWVSYLKIDGNSYIFNPSEDRNTLPLEMFLIQPNQITSRHDAFGIPKSYTIRLQGMHQEILFDPSANNPINHTKVFHPVSQSGGLSPFSPLRFSVELLNETNLFAVNFVQNRCTPPGVLSTEQNLNKEQRNQLERVLKEKYCGPDNAGTPLVLGGGLKWQSMAGSGKEQISILNGRDYNDRDIARVLGVPPILLGIPGDSTFNNMNEAKREFVLSTCRPTMLLLSQALNNWLLTNTKDRSLFLEPDIDDLPEIREWRMNSWKKVDDLKSISLNEKRELMGYDTKSGEVYDDLFVPANTVLASDFDSLMTEVDNSDSETLNDDDDAEGEKSFTYLKVKTIGVTSPRQRALYRKQYVRLFIQLERRLTKSMKRFFLSQGRKLNKRRKQFDNIEAAESAIDQQLAADAKILEGILSRHYRTSFTIFSQFLNDGFKSSANPEHTKQDEQSLLEFSIAQFIQGNAAKHVKILNDTTKARVVSQLRPIFEDALLGGPDGEALSLLDLTKQIQSTFSDFSLKRAAVIARTETTSAVTQGAIKSVEAMQLDKPMKTWLSDLRDTHRPLHIVMNETSIPLDDKFEVENIKGGIDLMSGPGDQTAPVSQLANCICILAFFAATQNEVE